MLKSLLKSAILGGIVVFVWSMFSWMILPWHDMTMNRFTDQNAVSQAILQNAPVNGTYVLPSMKPPLVNPLNDESSGIVATPSLMNQNDISNTNWNGPFVYANVVREGLGISMTRPMIVGFIIQIIAAFIITWLLLHGKAMRFWWRVRFVTVIGFLVGFLGFMPLWNWWGFTGGYALVGILDSTIAWFLGGLVIARMTGKH